MDSGQEFGNRDNVVNENKKWSLKLNCPPSFPDRTKQVTERKKKKLLAVPDTLTRKQRNFTELKSKPLRKMFAPKMLRKSRRKLIYEKLSITTGNIGRYTEWSFERR